jgi:hypothetical protein
MAGLSRPTGPSIASWWLSIALAWLLMFVPAICCPRFIMVLLPGPLVIGGLYPALLYLRSCAVVGANGSVIFTEPPSQAAPSSPANGTATSQAVPSSPATGTAAYTAPPELTVVDVASLRDALSKRHADDVLEELFRPQRSPLLKQVDGALECFALVSYRQQREVGGDNHTTMDAAALRSVADVAFAAGIPSVWISPFCYRSDGQYVHDEFCATLDAVMLRIRAVIWLARARDDAPSQCALFGNDDLNRQVHAQS